MAIVSATARTGSDASLELASIRVRAALSSMDLDADAQQLAIRAIASILELTSDLDPSAAHKVLRDALSAPDRIALLLSKRIDEDAFAQDDDVALSVAKALAETITAEEALTILVRILRELSDSAIASDVVAWHFTKPITEDLAVALDAIELHPIKVLADEAASEDSQPALRSRKGVSDIADALDAVLLAISMRRRDAAKAMESAQLLQQNYVEERYFGEDYLGTKRNF